MQVSLTKRDFSGPQLAGGIRWDVERLEWRAVGGPWSARLRARAGRGQAGLLRLWDLAGMLRCGVEVSDRRGAAWWGYLETVEIHWGARVVEISLADMWNRIMVEYRTYSPGSAGGEMGFTSIVGHAESIKEYGYKERVYRPAQQMSAAQAAAYAATMLAKQGVPVQSVRVDPSGGESEPYAVVTCRGWWDTLDWRFYNDSRGQVGNTVGGTRYGMGAGATTTKWAESFSCGSEAWAVSEVWVKLGKNGVPADNVKLDICANTGGVPGVSAAAAQLAGVAVDTELGWCKFIIAPRYQLAANTTYWLQLSRSGAADAANYYFFGSDASSSWAGGALRSWNGSAWVAWAPEGDMAFVVVGNDDNGTIISRVLTASPGCGQFLAGARQEAAVGVLGPLYRDGSTRGREELEALLLTGTSAGARLLASVGADRLARVFTQPGSETAGALMVGQGGEITRRDGAQLPLSEWPDGQWARLGEMAAASAMLGYSGAVFVEGCAWDGQVMRITG